MADLHIPFSAPMVRALLREIEAPGTGKTQTRRAHPPEPRFAPDGCHSVDLGRRPCWWDFWAYDRAETQAALAGCVSEETATGIVRGVWGMCETLEDEAHAKLESVTLTDHERGFCMGQRLAAKTIRRSTDLPAAIQPDTAKLALVREALRFYAGCYEPELSNPNSGPWGANSTDFGEKARAALSLITAQEEK